MRTYRQYQRKSKLRIKHNQMSNINSGLSFQSRSFQPAQLSSISNTSALNLQERAAVCV